MWSKERERMDIEEGTWDSERTLNLIREEANKLVSGLKFTIDSQKKNKDNKCPMLDLEVWKEVRNEGCAVIRHTFYEKDVTLPLVIHTKGAHTWRSKLVTLGEEVRRRLRNMDAIHSNTQILEILRVFLQKLVDSGYDLTSRQEII